MSPGLTAHARFLVWVCACAHKSPNYTAADTKTLQNAQALSRSLWERAVPAHFEHLLVSSLASRASQTPAQHGPHHSRSGTYLPAALVCSRSSNRRAEYDIASGVP